MQLRKIKPIALILLSIPIFHHAFSKAIPIVTKQPISNIRYRNDDGSVSYYQRRNGDLVLSSKFNLYTLLKSNNKSHFFIYPSSFGQNLIIEARSQFYSLKNDQLSSKLYYTPFNTKEVYYIASGQNPYLHLDDQWVSFVESSTQHLYFKKLKKNKNSESIQFSIQLKAPSYEQFFPSRVMLSPLSILYTDIKEDGKSALILVERQTSRLTPLYKETKRFNNLEICLNGKKLYIASWASKGTNQTSSIHFIDLAKTKDFKNLKLIYQSKAKDHGPLICQHNDLKLYFIKDIKDSKDNEKGNNKASNQLAEFELASLNLKTQKISILSDIGFASSIISMGSRLYTMEGSSYYQIQEDDNESQNN